MNRIIYPAVASSIVFLFACSSAQPPSETPRTEGRAAESGVRHRLHFYGQYPFVILKTEDGHPLRLILDTGAHGFIVTSDSLSLIPRSRVLGTREVTTQRGPTTFEERQIDVLRWDDEEYRSLTSFVIDREKVPLLVDSGLDGFLDCSFFRRRTVHLDYLRREVFLHQGHLACDNGFPGVAFREIEHLLLIDGVVNGTEGFFSIDTGTTITMISPEFRKRAALPEPRIGKTEDGASFQQIMVPTMRFGSVEADGILARIAEPVAPLKGEAGVLGSHFLFRLGGMILDYPAGRIAFPFRSHVALMEECKSRAARGDGAAQFALYQLRESREDTPEKQGEAIRWLQRAAASGNIDGLVTLGRALYFGGAGIKANPEEAFDCFSKAAAKGDLRAQSYLGSMYRDGIGTTRDLSKAAEFLREAAGQGDVDAQADLGHLFVFGNQRVPENQAEGIRLLRRAAERGSASAQSNLGLCYRQGLGVDQDQVAAMRWYLRAANQGLDAAMFNLGNCYREGATPGDLEKAREWYRKAASLGHREAAKALEELKTDK